MPSGSSTSEPPALRSLQTGWTRPRVPMRREGQGSDWVTKMQLKLTLAQVAPAGKPPALEGPRPLNTLQLRKISDNSDGSHMLSNHRVNISNLTFIEGVIPRLESVRQRFQSGGTPRSKRR
jgi:hypothetical protein